MALYSLSIRRPVLATVMATMIVIFGAIAFFFLGVREYPSVDPPVISVSTNYTGANADVIDAQITEPLEEQINGIEGIRTLTSVSREGRSTVTVEFDIGSDLERAANDVRDRVSRAQGQLPPDVDPPSVSKSDADAQPIVFLNISSEHRNLLELTELADNRFKERLQTIDGVSRVDIWGSKEYAMRLWIDPQQLAAYQLTPQDVRAALQRSNVELPSGRIEGQDIELTVRTQSRLETEEEFNRLILKQSPDGEIVRLEDVGRAEIGAQNERTLLRRDGTSMVGVVLRPLPGANYIDIVDEFYDRVDAIEADMPSDVSLGIGFDTTTQIRQSIAEVQQTIFIALLLVILVIFGFLRDWRSTLIPILVVPVALIGSFFVMYLAGFSINVLTLLAMVLAIGLVVDDAIVVLENIYAKLEEGHDSIDAGIIGTREIFFAVVATSISLVVVFLPIIFLGGLTGQLFQEFALVIAGAVAISSFVALTFTPMISTRLLKKREEQPWFYRKTEPFFEKLNDWYRDSLRAFLDKRWTAFGVIAVCLVIIGGLYILLPEELAPLEDRSNLRLFSTAREGATYEYMDAHMMSLYETVQAEVPEVEAVISVTSPGFGAASSVNSGFMRVQLVDPDERDRSQSEIADALTQRVNQMSSARTFVSQEETIQVGGGQGGQPVQYVLQAPNMDAMEEALPAFMDRARQSDVFSFVDVDLKFNKPELDVTIDRERADNIGVSPLDVAETLQLALSDQRVGFFTRDGQQREVIAQVDRENRDEPADLLGLYVRSSSGEPVLLQNIVNVEERSSPPQLFRFDRFRSATVSGQPAPGYSIGDGLNEMDAIAEEVLGPSFSTALDGPSRDYQDTSNQLLYVFALALLLIYLVLAAQFESFRDPFTILITVPLALTGALAFLWVFGQSINIFSQIGIVMLVGLVAKNGILIVEFAKQRKAAGLSIDDAITEAAAVRFRPILMTAFSTILGVMPIALAVGAGAESRIPMGLVVIGGLIVGTFLSLYVIPAMYTYLTTEEAGAVMASPAMEGTAGNGMPGDGSGPGTVPDVPDPADDTATS